MNYYLVTYEAYYEGALERVGSVMVGYKMDKDPLQFSTVVEAEIDKIIGSPMKQVVIKGVFKL